MAPRALDHIVWPTRDLDALVETFRSLGFTVGRRNRHPWGTVNHIVQFDGCFLELLGLAEDYRSVPKADPAFPFAGFCEAYLRRTDAGAAMMVLRSTDAGADARGFAAAGLGQGRMLPFAREAQGPDGRDASVAFTVAFADLPGLPEIGAFTCQQHRPENFWTPAQQIHPNGACGIAGLTVVGPKPALYAESLRRFVSGQMEGDGSDIILDGPGLIQVRSGEDPATIAMVTIWVSELDKVGRHLSGAGMPFTVSDGQLVARLPTFGNTALRFAAMAN